MSRVRKPMHKFVNTNKYDSSITGPSKTVRIKGAVVHPEKARTLTDWLFLKYDLTYKQFQRKPKKRRDALRSEYLIETASTRMRQEQECIDC